MSALRRWLRESRARERRVVFEEMASVYLRRLGCPEPVWPDGVPYPANTDHPLATGGPYPNGPEPVTRKALLAALVRFGRRGLP